MQIAELSPVIGSWSCWFGWKCTRFVVHNGSLAWGCAQDTRVGDLPRIMLAYDRPCVVFPDEFGKESSGGWGSIRMLVDNVGRNLGGGFLWFCGADGSGVVEGRVEQ